MQTLRSGCNARCHGLERDDQGAVLRGVGVEFARDRADEVAERLQVVVGGVAAARLGFAIESLHIILRRIGQSSAAGSQRTRGIVV